MTERETPSTARAAGDTAREEVPRGGERGPRRWPVGSASALKPGERLLVEVRGHSVGVFNVNGAHPFENPNAITNLLSAVAINVMGWAAFFAFGRTALAGRDVRALAAAALILLSVASAAMYVIETQPAPALVAAQVRPDAPVTSTGARPATRMSAGSSGAAVGVNLIGRPRRVRARAGPRFGW